MTEPANPLDNQAAISQLNQTLNVIADQFIRPNAQQIQSNAQQIQSNARAIEATNEGISELRNTVDAFVRKLDETGLEVSIVRDSSDDTAGDVAAIEMQLNRQTEYTNASIEALRADAIEDRRVFREEMAAAREKADEDREENARRFDSVMEEMAAAREKADEDREENAKRFDSAMEEIRAQGQQIRALLSALAATNGRVDSLEQAG